MGTVPFVIVIAVGLIAIEQFEIDLVQKEAMACRYLRRLVIVYSASEILSVSCLLKDRPGSSEGNEAGLR